MRDRGRGRSIGIRRSLDYLFSSFWKSRTRGKERQDPRTTETNRNDRRLRTCTFFQSPENANEFPIDPPSPPPVRGFERWCSRARPTADPRRADARRSDGRRNFKRAGRFLISGQHDAASPGDVVLDARTPSDLSSADAVGDRARAQVSRVRLRTRPFHSRAPFRRTLEAPSVSVCGSGEGAMFCAISGVTPTEPVISPAGHLFEKSLVTKALKVRGTLGRSLGPTEARSTPIGSI